MKVYHFVYVALTKTENETRTKFLFGQLARMRAVGRIDTEKNSVEALIRKTLRMGMLNGSSFTRQVVI